ncbi:hypothetical protein GCM10007161_13420 [Ignatzschineria indica]|uniref:Phage gp6-like head-tail connector protein n=1 Tax=Ignatzschineria indica TaxID=472583 RepID=A0A2U2AJQ3_9GAMM|nr:head-tail connector protein [Ignatzschineria indica]PWD83062.1 phage gp6-like head-tail connector protein [Ignatzschineria indica]GGZ83256.1 hypothetical protein GCM10007161_13420 [Ignatzschineria indica]
MMLVTLEEAKHQCYVDHEFDDELINLYIKTASAAVARYLKRDDLSAENAPIEAKYATLAYVGKMYKDRDNDEDRDYAHGMLPNFVTAILYPLREPTVQ